MTIQDHQNPSSSLQATIAPNALENRCRSLEDQLEQLRAQFRLDVEQLQSDVILKNRKISQLKAELAKRDQDEDGEDGEVKQLLLLAKALWGKRKNWAIDPGGDRWKLTAKQLKRKAYDFETLKTCIEQLAANPWCGARGYQPTAYPGAVKRLDVTYAYGEDERITMWLERASGERDPVAAAPPVQQSPVALFRAILPPDRPMQREGIDEVLAALTATGHAWRPAGPDRWMAQCPAHEDRSPSLSITRTDTRKVLLHCFAGCTSEDIVSRLGVSWRDLMGDEARDAA